MGVVSVFDEASWALDAAGPRLQAAVAIEDGAPGSAQVYDAVMADASVVANVIDFVRILAWPFVVLVVVMVFRRPLSERVGAIRKAQLPGGISVELDALQAEIVTSREIGASESDFAATQLIYGSSTSVLPSDRSYTVAAARVELERALRRFLFTVNRDEEFATRKINDVLLELRSSGELSPDVTRQAQDFLRLSAASFSSVVADEEVVAFHTVGSLLAAHVNYQARVASIGTGVWGHDLFFMVARGGSNHNEKEVWASITTILPEVAYDYRLFLDAIRRASNTRDNKNWPRDAADEFSKLAISEADFLQVTIFRRDELRRVLELFDRSSWLAKDDEGQQIPKALYYQWPAAWGKISFNTPVTGHSERPLLLDVADDLLRAEEAVRRMRLRQLPG